MPVKTVDLPGLLAALVDAGTEFIVIGGVAATLQGASISTFDLDLLYSRDPENLKRLERVLLELDSRYRTNQAVKPLASRFDGPGHHNLVTKFGPLDLLGSAVGGAGYTELIDHTEVIHLADGRSVHVLDLETLIHIKEQLKEDKDKLHLAILKRLQAEKAIK